MAGAPVPPYVPAAVLTVVVAVASDKLKWRGPFMLIFLPIAAIGASLLYVIYRYKADSMYKGISLLWSPRYVFALNWAYTTFVRSVELTSVTCAIVE